MYFVKIKLYKGSNADLMELKNARFPDHEHSHKHTGSKAYSFASQRVAYDDIKKGSRTSGRTVVKHIYNESKSVNVNFADMENAPAPVTTIKGSGIEKSTGANDLYPPHMRVTYIFKCY